MQLKSIVVLVAVLGLLGLASSVQAIPKKKPRKHRSSATENQPPATEDQTLPSYPQPKPQPGSRNFCELNAQCWPGNCSANKDSIRVCVPPKA
jgi:hypothetical protein